MDIWFYFMCMDVLSASMSVYDVCKDQEKALDPLKQVIDSCEFPSGYWELNPRPLREYLVFLTTEPPLYRLHYFLNLLFCHLSCQMKVYWLDISACGRDSKWTTMSLLVGIEGVLSPCGFPVPR